MKKKRIIRRMQQKILAFMLAFMMVFGNTGVGLMTSYADEIGTQEESAAVSGETGGDNESGSEETGDNESGSEETGDNESGSEEAGDSEN
ncbi:hypothetical protein, partial [Clostridium sp. MCC353]|uniref:hypothetical protein n=1 Tax=Clostridium sp. MCC353 TaxID=2592646 RepID=UPI001C024D26